MCFATPSFCHCEPQGADNSSSVTLDPGVRRAGSENVARERKRPLLF